MSLKTETIDEFISNIQIMYRKPYEREERGFIAARIMEVDKKALYGALKRFENNDDKFIPNPKTVVQIVNDENARVTRKPTEEPERPEKTDLQFKMFKEIISLFRKGTVSRQKILDMIREADKVNNNVGWHHAGMTLEKYYKSGNLDLSKPPNNHTSYEVCQ